MAVETAEIRRQLQKAVLAAVRNYYQKADADGSLGTQIDIVGIKGAKQEQLMELLAGEIKRSVQAKGFQVMINVEKENKDVHATYNIDGVRLHVYMHT